MTAGKCEYCGRWCRSLERNHIISRGAKGPEHALNYIDLGSAFDCGCHDSFHDRQKPSRAECLEIVARREGWASGQAVLEELWRLKRMIRVTKKGKLPDEKPKEKIIFGGTCNKCGAEVECDQQAALRGGVRCKTKQGKYRCFTWIKVRFLRKELRKEEQK